LYVGSESEQPASPVNLRGDGVHIDLPNREEIEGADSVAAELLKNREHNLVGGCITCSDSAGLD
jgi:hypothetical protein